MNLWQSMFALGALVLLGLIALNANHAILSQNETVNDAESGITAIALAQSLVEEAMSKYFDSQPETAISGAVTKTNDLTPPGSLGRGSTERYRGGVNDFNDFDDFNNLFLVYKSDNPADTARTPGSDWETIVPGLRAKLFVRARVQYVRVNASSIPLLGQVSNVATWHKILTVSVINPTTKDTLVYPALMSYWD